MAHIFDSDVIVDMVHFGRQWRSAWAIALIGTAWPVYASRRPKMTRSPVTGISTSLTTFEIRLLFNSKASMSCFVETFAAPRYSQTASIGMEKAQ
jgi:hypothetical protein